MSKFQKSNSIKNNAVFSFEDELDDDDDDEQSPQISDDELQLVDKMQVKGGLVNDHQAVAKNMPTTKSIKSQRDSKIVCTKIEFKTAANSVGSPNSCGICLKLINSYIRLDNEHSEILHLYKKITNSKVCVRRELCL